jgi:hypothetical protein
LSGGKEIALAAAGGVGAQGFANWLKDADGRRSLEDLLQALPVDRRTTTREAMLEWGPQAEKMFQGADLKAFSDALLTRAARLPASWVAELKALRSRLDEDLPPMRELLAQAYRVFAIFMIVLLLANLFFPDNLYAKGYYGGHGGGEGTEIVYSSYGGSPFHYHGARYFGRVYDSGGRAYAPVEISFSDPNAGLKRVTSKLALTANLQLMDTGAVAYAIPVADFKFYLEPGFLRVLNAAGKETLVLAPPPEMENAVRTQITSQKELITKAIPDHERWLQWIGWATFSDEVRDDRNELAALKEAGQALDKAAGLWAPGPSIVKIDLDGKPRETIPGPNWTPLFPGVYLAEATGAAPMAVFLAPDGGVRKVALPEAGDSGDEARFLRALVERRKSWTAPQSW